MKTRAAVLACVTLAALAAAYGSSVTAAPRWQVAAASASTGIRPPGFPADFSSVEDEEISRDGRLSLRLRRTSVADSLWVQDAAGSLRPVAQITAAGALGPGRAGSEADDRFSTLWFQDYASNATTQLFVGVAAGSVGMWRHDGQQNIELARAGSDGALGPGLGAGVSLIGTLGGGNRALGRIVVLGDGGFALGARLQTPGSQHAAILRYRADGGITLCAEVNNTDPAIAPGVFTGPDRFVDLGGLNGARDGDLFAIASARAVVLSPTQVGIWRFCDGAPQPRMLVGNTGSFGPRLPAAPLADFIRFESDPMPLTGDAFVVEAVGRTDSTSPTSPLFRGLFHHGPGGNAPLAVVGDLDGFGPGLPGSRFTEFLGVGGENAVALRARVSDDASSVREGLWRLQSGRPPEPLALVGSDAALAPAPGRRWAGFDAAVALANGDIIALGSSSTVAGDALQRALWRLRPGRAPQRLLGPGDSVDYRDAAGTSRSGVITSVDGLPLGSSLRPLYAADEGWISADGVVLLRATLAGIAGVVAVQTATPLLDRSQVFVDGFEP